jgi:twitching motility protein PilT
VEENFLGQILVNNHFATKEQIEEAVAKQKKSATRRFLGEILVEEGIITQRILDTVLSVQRRRLEMTGKTTVGLSREVIQERMKSEDISEYASLALEMEASDIYIMTDQKPSIRLHGSLIELDRPAFEAAQIEKMIEKLIGAEEMKKFRESRDMEITRDLKDKARYRANFFFDSRGPGVVLRVFHGIIRDLAELGFPLIVKDFALLNQGFILVTGPISSGKSTVLNALVQEINKRQQGHIVTIEDPIEVVFEPEGCVITQREVGRHTNSFAISLRAALREDPDFIVVAELRDLETILTAIQAAETGHLVLGTLHTANSVRTIHRIIDAFPAVHQPQIRSMLSGALRAVISLQLVPNIDGQSRSMAKEILLVTPAVSNMIREDRAYQIPQIMQTTGSLGMRLMDDSLAELVKRGKITFEEALLRAEDKSKITKIELKRHT